MKFNKLQLFVKPSLLHKPLPSRSKSSTAELPTKRKLTQSYVHGASSVSLLDRTIGQLVDDQAEARPDEEAFVLPFQNIRKTFAEIKKDTDAFAAGLLTLGLQRSDRVGIWGPNSYEWLVTQFATAKAGLILVNVNPAYKVHELEYCLNKAQVKLLVAAEGNRSLNYYDMMKELCPDLQRMNSGHCSNPKVPHLRHVVTISQKFYDGVYRFADISNMETRDSIAQLEKAAKSVGFDDAVNIQFTSGTTGNPKGATLTHHNVVNNSYFAGRRLNMHLEKTRVCSPVPLYHCFGCVLGSLTSLTHGACVVIPDVRFDPEATLKAVSQEKCSIIYGVPTMYSDQLHHPNFKNYDTSSLRAGIMSGAPCPGELVKQVRERMHVKNLLVAYGMTETSPVSHMSHINDPPELSVHTVGTALDHVEVKIMDSETGAILPTGSKGEICVRGFLAMCGYWEDDAKTKETISSTGWVRSGDMGVMDENGYVRIVGRSKDTIIRGGENVYPVEIENLLHQHPKVAEAYVVGVPDERLGEEICCWVRAKSDSKVTEKELRTFCGMELASFKVPRYYIFLKSSDTFPLTVTGKVQKFKMREQSVRLLKLEKVKDSFDQI